MGCANAEPAAGGLALPGVRRDYERTSHASVACEDCDLTRGLDSDVMGNITAKDDLPECARFLPKPYDVAVLSEAFEQMARG